MPIQTVTGTAATAMNPIGPKTKWAKRAGQTSSTTTAEAGEKSRIHGFGGTRQGTNRTLPR